MRKTDTLFFQWSTDKKNESVTRLAKLETRRHALIDELGKVEGEMAATEVRMKLIDELAEEARRVLVSASDGMEPDSRELPSPTDAVMELIEKEPGIPRTAVFERLKGNVKTTSPRPSTVISAVVSRGKHEKTLWQTRGGRVYPFDHPDAVRDRGNTILRHTNRDGSMEER